MKTSDVRVTSYLSGVEVVTGLAIDQTGTERWFFTEPHSGDVFFVDDNAYWEEAWYDDEWLKGHHCRWAGRDTEREIKILLRRDGFPVK